jgi:hypothetical protein
MVMTRDQNAGQYHNIQTGKTSFESMEQFKYLGTTLTTKIASMKKLKAD